MTSDEAPAEAYVWIWLPGETTPVVAGIVERHADRYAFTYGRSYLERTGSMAIYEGELPLKAGRQWPAAGLAMAGSLRDAAPDAWGRRVILNRRFGSRRQDIDIDRLDELIYLLESGSDRIGALDFQRSPTEYAPREGSPASLEELLTAADRVQRGEPLTAELDRALFHGSSIGGARPKALVVEPDRKHIAKFSAAGDVFNVVKAEYVGMRLAALAGLDVAPVRLTAAAGRDVLLVERFDRQRIAGGWTRRALVSALTLFGLDEMLARYASYEDLCTLIRHRFANPAATLRELFRRLVLNVLVGNTDDHARNHAAIWDGEHLTLSPAYDICPQGRAGNEATQAMLIHGQDRRSQLAVCRAAARNFLLSEAAADDIFVEIADAIRAAWPTVCEEAALGAAERRQMWGRQVFNPFVLEGLPPALLKRVQA